MPSLTLKNVPAPLLRELRVVAAERRRSLSQQAIVLLEAAVGGRAPDQSRAAQVKTWKEIGGRWIGNQSSKRQIADVYGSRRRGREVDW